MAKVRSKCTVEITSVGGTSWQLVGNRIDVNGPEVTAAEIDGSDMDSVLREYFGDIPDGGEVTITGNRNFSDIGQGALRIAVGQQRDVRVIWLDPADDSPLETATFTASILRFATTASSGSMVGYEATARVSGAITYT